ncbi:MAG: gliding motility-associated C-terminal domain-containing protein, partial [Flavobacterium sp.]
MKNLYFNSIVKNLKHIVVLLAILFGFSNTINAQVKKTFTQRTSQYSPTKKIYNVKGDFTMLGNTCLTPQFYTATTNNNDATMVYVDVDSDANTFNSSTSTLVFNSENGSVPACSNIVYAGLYWTGRSAPNTTFTATKTFLTGQPVNNDFNAGNGQSVGNSYSLAISRGGNTNARYPIYTFTSGVTSYAFRFYNSGVTNRVTVSVNGGTETNLPSSINAGGTEATLNTPYVIANGTATITIKKLIRDAGTNLSTTDTQNLSSIDLNVSGTSTVVSKTLNKRVVKLKGPASSAYTEITADPNDIYYPSTSDDYIYSAYAEVTDYVKTNGLGAYTVADLALLEGNPGGTGYSGGWAMVVVYENNKMKWRDVTIFDGYAYVESGNSAAGLELPVSGFNSAISGNVGMKIGVIASEGDIGYTGDYFKIRNLQSANYTTLSRTDNGVVPNPDNFFRSYINAPGTRTPDLLNNTGIDIGIINIPNTNNSIIGNNQTSTRFLYGTNGDTYSIFTIAMSVDAYVPEAEGIITATTINNQPAVSPYTILPGQDAGFSIDVRNLGTEAINNYKVVIPIPYNASYVPGSASGTIYYTNPNTTITGTFDPTLGATGSIVWNFGTLPLPANPTTLLAKLTFKLKATTDCEILANATCSSVIAVNGNSVGVGSTTNVALNNSTLIQGYTQNGSCVGTAIPTPINVGIDGVNYVQTSCPGTDFTRHFSYCSASTTVKPSEIASNFPTGSLFYNSFPVTLNSVQFTESNPIPLVAGSTVTYYAIPPGGGSGCNFPFTVAKCPVIIAQDDTIAGGNGTTGNPNAGNVLNNNGNGADTLNGTPATISQVNITVTTPATPINGGPVPSIDVATGQISVPAGTPAGTYTIVYNLCEKLNPTTNCDPATVTITVTKPVIIAQDDTLAGGNGTAGNPNAGNVLNNNGNGPDTLNGANADISLVNITVTTPATSIGGAPVPVLAPATGQVSVPAGTPAGTYTIVYNLCEKLNPTNCDPATVTITVTKPVIIAQDDTLSGGNGMSGNPNAGNVLNNNGNGPDTLNGNPVAISEVNITVTTPATPIAGAPVPTLVPSTGQVYVPAGTPAGTYTIVYNLCEKLNPTNCDPATVTITVTAPAIIAQDDTLPGGNGTTGNPNIGNVLNNNGNGSDTLNGATAAITLVNITVTTPAAPINGGPVPTLSTTTGDVSVPAGTPAGTYTIVYNLCEKLNPTNCDPATVTITVTAPAIIAQDDTLPGGNGTTGNSNIGNVLNNNGNGNDTLNGNNALITQVNITVTTPATPIGGAPVPVLAPATGIVSVPAGTPAGTYTIVYNLCEKLNPTNCDPATVTITVTAPAIIAQDDTISGGNGTTGNPNAGNVLNNNGNGPDTLNGNPVNISQVNITVTTPATPINGGPVPSIDVATGQISVPAGTPAGTYTIVYNLCEKLNPTNCDPATVTITVTAPAIIAQDDTISGGNGTTGNPNAGNVLNNNGNGPDTLNGNPVNISQVNITVTTPATPINGGPVPSIDVATGQISVPAGTPAGTYTIVYNLCEKLNPTNCDPATVTITVTAPAIIAQDDTISGGNGTTGNPNAGNVLNNNGNGPDTLNGNPVNISQVNITVTTPATPINGGPVPSIDVATGQISVPAGTPAGTYTIVYNLCEKLNPTNCDPATVTITVTAPAIIAQDDTISGGNGTTGNPNAGNVLNNNGNGPDTLNGNPVNISQVNITVTTPATPINGGPVPSIDVATGQISVPAGTPAGTYTIIYNLCEKLNPTNCDPATVTITVTAPVIIAEDDTMSGGNGTAGNPNAGNVLNNNGNGPDTLNSNPVNISQVNITVTTPAVSIGGGPVPVLAPATGIVSVPAGTPAGTYTIVYNLCEKLNPTNCDPATVTIVVAAGAIVAEDDNYTNIQCSNVGLIGNILSNDSINTTIGLSISDVNLTILSGNYPNLNIDNLGNVNLTSPGSCGSYTFTYRICEKLNPSNCDTATVTITIQDLIAPTFTAPADITINTTANCTYDASVAATGDVTNEADNCSTGLQATFTDSVADGQCAGSKVITRTWSLVDACGNAAPTQTQTITVTDNIAPTFTAPADITINTTANCTYDASVAATGDVTNEADNCSTGLQATFTDSVADGQCAGSKVITRTWSLVDACGNAAPTQTQTITVTDNIAPTFTAPADITINTTANCTYDASVAATGDVTNEADNCSTGLQATFTDSIADGQCAGSKVITRTWSLVDACGNAAPTQTQTITVTDNIAPTFTAPADITINTTADCTYDASVAATGDVTNEADNCSTGLQATFTDSVADGQCAGSKVITRTWSLVDACGNAAPTQTQTITVTDNIAPTFTAPADITINTTANCTYDASVAATGDVTNEADNCSTGLQATFTDSVADGQCAGSKVITRTWSLVDACGNAAPTQTQTITVTDNIAPTFTAPANITISTGADCSYDASVSAAGDVTDEADNCSTGLQATFTDSVADGQCAGSKVITRIWSLVDACGNAAQTQTQTITVTDNIAPTFTAPADITINTTANCTYDASVAATGDVTNEADNCSTGLQATFTDSVADGQCAGSKVITRTWSLVDACGNAAPTQTQTITVTDNIAPTFTAPADITINTTANCTYDASVAATGDVTNEADNCSTGLQATFTDSIADGQCAGSKVITRTWSLVDACGNAAPTQTQTITVTDNIAPTFTAPADITINTTADCTYDASVAATGDVTNEADNCSTGLQATFTDSVADGQCAGSKVITRTWSLVDACGNAAPTQTQTITVTDNIAPTFTAPADITINTTANCTYDASVAATGDVTNEADNCSMGLQATFTDSVADGQCAGSKVITRTWSLVDACGNAAPTQTQTITVTDNIAPTFTAPANITISTGADCSYDASVSAAGDVTDEADNCSTGLQATFTDSIAEGACAGSKVITRTWSLVDACGNAAPTQTQTITVTDNIAPVFSTQASNIIVECDGQGNQNALNDWLNNHGGAVASDNCSDVTWSNNFNNIANDCSAAVTVVFTATDACGNASTSSATFTINDTVAPTFTAPADITINTTANCTYDASVAATGDVTNEADNCSTGLQATFTDSIADGQCAGSKVITRTWSLVDACGNAAPTQTQTITVTDNIAPTFTAPADITINTTANCTYDASVAATGDVTNEADNCSTGLQATFTDSVADGQCAGSKVITRTWSLVDACGNAAPTQTQTITVTDNIAPTFTAPADITINTTANCTYDASVAATGDVTNEADNCSTGLQATFTDSVADGQCAGSKVITRTWSLVDACGNAAPTQTQTITVTDNIAPTFTAPADITINTTANCTYDASVAATGDVTNEADNCSTGLQATFTDSVADGQCAGSKVITRTWSLVDACGNAAPTQTQTITVTDNIAPTFTAPADITINTTANCTYDASVAATGDVTNEADNCSTGLQATFTDSVADGQCAGSKVITRTWSLVDACGNAAPTQTQTITVTDNIAPTFTAPADITINTTANCTYDASVAATGDVTNEADNCSTGLQATFTDSVADGQCAGSKVITRTWSLVDACGNAAPTQTQTITVTDNIAPTFTAPADITINTTADCTYDASVAATGDVTNEADNCSTGLQATFTDSVADGQCAGSKVITRTWSLVDACGNAAPTQIQIITVSDTTAPVAPQAPASITATCSGEVPAMVSLTATDNCSGSITVNGVDSVVQGSCPNSFTITRTWTFVDACGNSSSATQTISVNDNVAPTFDQAAPANINVSCENIPAPAQLTATDNCGTATVNVTETILAGSCPSNYQIIRTWVATDACGNNSAPVSQTITVSDTTGPQIITQIPPKMSVICSDVPVAPVLTAADFTDNCSTVGTPVFTETQTQPEGGHYIITRTWTVSDACGNTTTITQIIAVTLTPETTTVTPRSCTFEDLVYTLRDLLDNPNDVPANAVWTNESGAPATAFNGTTFNAIDVPTGEYIFSYTIETGECPRRIEIKMTVDEDCTPEACISLDVHNAFTPNGDGLNEWFQIDNIDDITCYPTNKVQIYNRWGILVYETKNYDNNVRK